MGCWRDIHVLLLNEHLNKLLDCAVLVDRDIERFTAAHRTVLALLVFECVGVYTVCADEHEVVVQIGRGACSDLERFVTT